MTTPPGLVGLALGFWGWQTGLWPPAILLALLLEGARVTRWRWDLSRRDFYRVSDLSSVLFVAVVLYAFLTSAAALALTLVFQWLPLITAPLVTAQAYSTTPRLDPGVVFWSLRRTGAEGEGPPSGSLHTAYLYVALCVLAASAANVRGPWFYPAAFALAAWALWSARSRRYPPLWWGALLVAVGLVGYGGHVAVHNLQRALLGVTSAWLAEYLRRDTDPYRSTTAIGHLGQLKLSDRIALRVEGGAARPSTLLREASYNVYDAPVWLAVGPGFESVLPEADGETWKLRPGSPPEPTLTVSAYLKRGRGILALPGGAHQLDRLLVVGVSRNRLGAVRVEEGLGLITYGVRFRPGAPADDPPEPHDLRIPAREADAVGRLAAELGLAGQAPAAALETVSAFFRRGFGYSTFHADRPVGGTAIGDFLLRSRSGHCEYFATATVLLLRAAGIPARYATGYSVQEWSRLEKRYVVRARHAHAWALAYLDGAWRDVDTTPAAWVPAEAAAASAWEPLADLAAWGWFLFSRWRFGETTGGVTGQLGWLLIPLVLILALRWYSRKRAARVETDRAGSPGRRAVVGGDSEFYAIEGRLRELGLGRHAWEPPARWLARIGEAPPLAGAAPALTAVVRLHTRYRFDPRGLSPADREALRAQAGAWWAEHNRDKIRP